MSAREFANPRAFRHAPEKAEIRQARRLMELLGFTMWNLSQSRASQQTPGWPDLYFTHPDKGIAFWYESKAPGGRQTPQQRIFQAHVEACGQTYLVGTAAVVIDWARSKGLVL